MAKPPVADLVLPRSQVWGQEKFLAAPDYASFTSRFGDAFPTPQYLESDLGVTAVYDLPPPSGRSERNVLIIHGIDTPAMGMWPLAKELQALDPNTHVVLFDIWGTGLTSTPLVAHTQHIFHLQIFQVLGLMQWTSAHFMGYSFGGSTAIRFALHNPKVVSSVALLAPAGILRKELFSQQLLDLMQDYQGKEEEAMDCVMDFLEDGPLTVPQDWQERFKAGEVVGEALREWSFKEHPGYRHSLLSKFRDGGVYGCEDYFRQFAQLPVRKVSVLGETDPVCIKSQLVDLGFSDVEVVANAGHALVRTNAKEVAGIVYKFWTI